MNQSQAEKAVLASLLVAGAIVVYDNVKRSGKASPGGKQLVAYTVVAAGLAVGASVAPSVAGPLAILIALAVAVARVSPGTISTVVKKKGA